MLIIFLTYVRDVRAVVTFVVAEEEADGADEDSAVLAEHLSLVAAVLAALLVKAALLDDNGVVLGFWILYRDYISRFWSLHRDCLTRGGLLDRQHFERTSFCADNFVRVTQASCWISANPNNLL